MRVFLVCLLVVAAVATEVKKEDKKISRRGVWAQEHIPSNEGWLNNNYAESGGWNPISGNGWREGVVGSRQIASNSGPITETVVNRVVQVPVAVPRPVEVVRSVPVRVPQPYPVEVRRPVTVHVPQPYPVHVNKPYPVHVNRPVPVLVPHAVRVTYPRVPVPVQVPQAYIVPIRTDAVNYAAAHDLGAYANQGAIGYSGENSYDGNYNGYQRYAESESTSGSWGGASYPGLEAPSNSEGYSYEPPAKRW